MERVARTCVAHDVVMCSDEVWGELPLQPEEAPFCSALALLPRDGGGVGAGAAGVEPVEGLRERLVVLLSPVSPRV